MDCAAPASDPDDLEVRVFHHVQTVYLLLRVDE
jgi:hypothetical protein